MKTNINLKYSVDTLRIFADASTIFERIENAWNYIQSPTKEEIERYKNNWEQILSKQNGKERLERFFKYEQISEETLNKMFSKVQVNEKTEIPEWLDTLEQVLTLYRNDGEHINNKSNLYPNEDHVLFEELMFPWIQVYQELLRNRIPNNHGIIHEDVFASLERSLLIVIIRAAEKVLFNLIQSTTSINSHSILSGNEERFNEQDYQQFIKDNANDNFISLLKEYPMLARILTTFTQNIAHAHARFISRLVEDYEEIKTTFFPNEPIGEVIQIKNSISDFHKGGESVVLLKFENGKKLAYKPKNLDLAEHFNSLVAWVNEQGSPIDFKQTKVINKKTYGWVEYISSEECKSEKEVKQYYLRAGALLCLSYLVEGTDFHYENIIASGAFPVIVDFETILTPRPIWENTSSTIIAKTEEERNSVLRTCFLPVINKLSNNEINFGGFGGKISEHAEGLAYLEHEVNIPHYKGKRQDVSGYRAELKQGFKDFYHFMATKKPRLLGDQSPLKNLNNLPVRVLFRNTYIYEYVTRKLSLPKSLKNGIDFSIQMEVLAKGLLKPATKPLSWEILAEERASIKTFDFPFFTTSTSSLNLKVNDEFSIKNFYQKPSYMAMMELIENMGEAKLLSQIKFIDKSLDQLYSEPTSPANDALSKEPEASLTE